MLSVMFLRCWRISLVCLALKLVGSWVELGFSAGFWVSSCQLMFPGVRSFLMFSSFGFKHLPLAFSLFLTVASRLLHPCHTDDKTSRLMVKRFSTVGDIRRDSQSYMEKRRRRREIEATMRRRGIKRGESNLASNRVPICSPQSGTLREVHGVP